MTPIRIITDAHQKDPRRPKTQDPITKDQILQHDAPIAKITRYYCTKHPKPEKLLTKSNREATLTQSSRTLMKPERINKLSILTSVAVKQQDTNKSNNKFFYPTHNEIYKESMYRSRPGSRPTTSSSPDKPGVRRGIYNNQQQEDHHHLINSDANENQR
ncbi:hypothetical protein B9Z55_022068 [Caenorhabditis nigoni]|uniref:Uncharacterized protein n=1 Tax=Caenorhabditis nigoni TaxID=1611254 RepID=A0A2G5TUQ2_9PELO|nr:hypothetical protein B9Z55_022068 [Caenorhabditis nigoni]